MNGMMTKVLYWQEFWGWCDDMDQCDEMVGTFTDIRCYSDRNDYEEIKLRKIEPEGRGNEDKEDGENE